MQKPLPPPLSTSEIFNVFNIICKTRCIGLYLIWTAIDCLFKGPHKITIGSLLHITLSDDQCMIISPQNYQVIVSEETNASLLTRIIGYQRSMQNTRTSRLLELKESRTYINTVDLYCPFDISFVFFLSSLLSFSAPCYESFLSLEVSLSRPSPRLVSL